MLGIIQNDVMSNIPVYLKQNGINKIKTDLLLIITDY